MAAGGTVRRVRVIKAEAEVERWHSEYRDAVRRGLMDSKPGIEAFWRWRRAKETLRFLRDPLHAL